MIRLYLLLTLSLCLCGCCQPLLSEEQSGPTTKPLPEPEEAITEDVVEDDAPAGIAVTVNVSPSVWSFVTQHLTGNTIRLEKAITVQQADGLLIEVPAGVTVAMTGSEDAVDVSFSQPYPTATKYKVVKTSVRSITLRQDGSGIARTGLKDFKFRWTDDVESSAPKMEAPPLPEQAKTLETTLPEVTMFSSDGCKWCVVAERELAAVQLPFQVFVTKSAPSWVQSFPTFYWRASDGKYKQARGWKGVSDLLNNWKSTQQLPQSSSSLNYRQRGKQNWTFPGNTREELIHHLLSSPEHRNEFDRVSLDQYSFQDLLEMHSDDHEGVL